MQHPLATLLPAVRSDRIQDPTTAPTITYVPRYILVMSPLSSLPTELLQTIIEGIADRATLIALAQTCSTLRPLAEAQIFASIEIHSTEQLKKLAVTREKRPERFSYVRKLEYSPANRLWTGKECHTDLVGDMTKLRELRVDSPLINGRIEPWWAEGPVQEYMTMFHDANSLSGPDAPLQRLTSCEFLYHSSYDFMY